MYGRHATCSGGGCSKSLTDCTRIGGPGLLNGVMIIVIIVCVFVSIACTVGIGVGIACCCCKRKGGRQRYDRNQYGHSHGITETVETTVTDSAPIPVAGAYPAQAPVVVSAAAVSVVQPVVVTATAVPAIAVQTL